VNRIWRLFVFCAATLIACFLAQSSVFVPTTTDEQIQKAAAIFRGTVESMHSYRDARGQIHTRTVVRVSEVFKGKAPQLVKLLHGGGLVEGVAQVDDFAPQFKVGEERLFFVSRHADGSLYASRGEESALKLSTAKESLANGGTSNAQSLLQELRSRTSAGVLTGNDLSDQAAAPTATAQDNGGIVQIEGNPVSTATNLILDGDGIPSRFVAPDRGEPIPYLIDADYLPAGITLSQATNAVQTALAAWTNVTSARFVFAGLQSFGEAAPYVTNFDEMLRIQLHDHYNFIATGAGSDVLGKGGRIGLALNLAVGWTLGGNVAGNDFDKTGNGALVLNHTNSMMTNLTTFTEVLCHEIGHALGLAHSSENPSDPNPILNQAIMFCVVHADGRGATLNSFDINTSRQIHPATNTPPYTYDRVMDVVTSYTPMNVPGLNTIEVRGYDLQTTNLTFAMANPDAGDGTFTNTNNRVTFVPSGAYETSRIDPSTPSYYDLIYARFSDGVNASPYAIIRVVWLAIDSYNEGIPDDWRLTYFGSSDPTAGPKRHALDDNDGDGFNNLTEFRLGSDPTDKTSNLRITSFGTTNIQWQAKPYEIYEIYTSTNLTSWVRAMNPITPTDVVGSATVSTNGSRRQFFRIQKVP
jgi:hypothetical protein